MSAKNPARGRSPLVLNQIHPTALVHPDAQLGRGVSVGPFSIIGPEVEIGDETQIASNVLIENRVTLGRRNRVHHGAVLGSPPQDLKYLGARSSVVIGDDNTLREYVTVNIATQADESTRIGNRCLIMAYAHVAHNTVLGDNVIMGNSVNPAGHVEIDDWAVIGGMTAIHQFVHIGAHSMVGGASRIAQDVPPYVKVAGSPPVPGGVNSVGLRRRGFDEEQLARVKSCYRYLYRRNLRVEEALERMRQEADDEIYATFSDFLSRSSRGIVR